MITKEKIKKYFVTTTTKKLCGIILILGVLLYVACLCMEINNPNSILLHIGSNAALVFISVFGSAFVSTLIIDVEEHNAIYRDTMSNEILLSPVYYDYMSESNKYEVLKYIESQLYFNNNEVLSKMNENIKNKIKNFDSMKYFFSDYSAIITCEIKDGIIKKDITKTMHVCSYDEGLTLDNLELANHVFNKSKDMYGIVEGSFSLKIDGKNEECFKKVLKEPQDSIEKKSGYDSKVVYQLTRPLELKSKIPVLIEVSYETIVEGNDIFTAVRLPVASERTHFQFSLKVKNEEREGYELVTSGFGFADNASKTPNSLKDPHTINLDFNEWIFPHDGWVVVIKKKDN